MVAPSENAPNPKQQKRPKKPKIQNSVKINEVSGHDSSFAETPRKTEDERDLPIIETPETSKNESSTIEKRNRSGVRRAGPALSHIKRDYQHNNTNTNSLVTNSTSYSEMVIPIHRSNSALPRYNMKMFGLHNHHVYPGGFNPMEPPFVRQPQQHRHQTFGGPVDLNYTQNKVHIINRDRDWHPG